MKKNHLVKLNLFLLLFILTTSFLQAQCWKEISTGGSHTLAIQNNGTLWGWGNNTQGQLGDGTTVNKTVPTQIGTDSNWKTIKCGSLHSMAIKTDGTLWSWGGNTQGQLGDGTNTNKLIPTQIGTNTDWKLISCGSFFSVAIKMNGDIWTCGLNNVGQLGDGTLINKNTFNQILSGSDWKMISTGVSHTMAIKTDNTLWGWGYNVIGSLGNGPTGNILIPSQIGNNNDWKNITCGAGHTLALKNDNTLWGWGQNDHRQVGNGNNLNQYIPIQIGTSSNWKEISAGGIYSLALRNDNTLWAWGNNSYGQLGNNTTGGDIYTPTQFSSNTDWNKIYCSSMGSHSFALKTNQLFYAWGYNVQGQLGDGTTILRNSPTQINCPVMTIIANNDTGNSNYGIANVAIANVLSNDTYNSLPATFSNIILTLVSSPNNGITLNINTGEVNVSELVPIGNYTLTYQICAINNPSNCSIGTVTINVICNSPTFDLMIKDGIDDIGNEPNNITEYIWASTDIWIRNTDDSGLEHQNPEYHPTNPNFAYIRVTNKSCVQSNGNEVLKFYWAKAGSSLAWPASWDGNNYFTQGPLMGAPVGQSIIPILQPNQETIVKIPFIIPNPTNYNWFEGGEQWHFCLLARIESSIDLLNETSDLVSNVQNNNGIAWKNVTIVDVEANVTSGTIAVGNPFNTPRTFFLEFVKEDIETGKPIFEEAEVGIKMDDVLYQAWVRGGKEAQQLDTTLDEKRKIVKGNNVILDNILFYPNEIGFLTLDFNFLTKEQTEKSKFKYHVVQKDALTGAIIGGETYEIKKKTRTLFVAEAPDKEVDLNQALTISAEDINEPAIYNWYDSEGNLIYQGKDLQIATAVSEKYKLEVISTVDGFKDYVEVEVKLKPSTIETISPNPAQNNVTILYKLNSSSSAYLMILDYYGNSGTSNNYILDVNSNEININVNNYPNGFYSVALVIDGNIVDAKVLIKE